MFCQEMARFHNKVTRYLKNQSRTRFHHDGGPQDQKPKNQEVPLNRSLRELLLKLNLISNGNRYVFENPKTEKPYTDLKRGWRSALERAGINDMRFHDLRPTFASHFLMNGGDLYTLKEVLGHKDITTTSRYLTITTEQKSKAMEIFEVPENESNIIELAG